MNKKPYIDRLHRIEGQLRGIERMWLEDRQLVTIIQQLDAAKSSLNKLIVTLLVNEVLMQNEQTKNAPSGDVSYLKRYLEKLN